MRFEITATDTPTVSESLISVSGGSFSMGNSFEGEGNNTELPVHSVTLDAFRISSREVNFSTWEIVRNWASAHGFSFTNLGSGKAPNHPVQNINWHDAAKWCNARSEMEGLTPCYTIQGKVYRTGETTPDWDNTANGYRLPTEAEWERAARGYFIGKRFPLGNTISHMAANYSAGRLAYESPQGNGFHTSYASGGFPYTSPVGSFAPNALQIYDMTGNVNEWCWDWYDPGFYAKPEAANNPAGPASPTTAIARVIRGGGWNTPANSLRVAARFGSHPSQTGTAGLRIARNSP
jgi:formylglycine-generating enzyme required for sulfatase activity